MLTIHFLGLPQAFAEQKKMSLKESQIFKFQMIRFYQLNNMILSAFTHFIHTEIRSGLLKCQYLSTLNI